MLRILVLAVSLVLCCASRAQERHEQLRSLLAYAVRANHFNTLYPQEKVYLHFDNTAYFSGETIWFSANVVGATASDTAFSKVLYVELLSPTGVVLQQQKLKIEDGRCHGAFPLVDASVKEANAKRGVLGYPSGYYEVRAYTLSMLNFDAYGCFSRVFPVYETPEKEGDYDNPSMKRYMRKEEIRPETKATKGFHVEFFPEGGHLICGVENRIAFKATDSNGRGVDVEGLTIGGELVSISPQHLGMGYFMYTPEDKRHKVDVLYEGKHYTFSLPESMESGYALQVNRYADDTLYVDINTLQADTAKLFAMTLMHAGKVQYVDTLTLNAPNYQKVVSTAHLPTGTYQLSLFDADGVVHATRMLFCNNGVKEQSISIATSKPHHKPFEKIEMRIETTSEEEQYVSLAVRDAADYGTGYDEDIRTYMLLSSELKGYIEQPGYYFEADDEEHRTALDLLMMVQGWSRYSLERMQQSIPTADIHYTEESLVLEGRTLHPRKEEPMAGVDVCIKLYSPDRQQVQEIKAVSDEYGYWGVNLQDFEGEWDLNIQTYRNGEPIVARLRLERASAPEVLAYPLAALPLQHRMDTTGIAVGEDVEELQQLPESSILLDNVDVEGRRRYVDFCTFQAYDVAKDKELIIDKGEYTNMVADYLIDKGYTVTRWEEGTDLTMCLVNGYRTLWMVLSGTRNLTRTSYTPGFDIDIQDVKSVMVFDSPHSYIGNPGVYDVLAPEEILRLQRADDAYPPGLYVVEIHLYPKLKSPISWNRNTRQTTFDGYSPKVEFYSPQYPNGPIQGDADYRRTLYWNPEVKVINGKAEVTFYNNSYSKHLHISAEGITSNGEFIVYDSDKPTD